MPISGVLEKRMSSFVSYEKPGVLAALAEEVKGGDGAKSAWREVLRSLPANRRFVSQR